MHLSLLHFLASSLTLGWSCAELDILLIGSLCQARLSFHSNLKSCLGHRHSSDFP